MKHQATSAVDPEFIGTEPCGSIDNYLISMALYRMPRGGIRYVVDAADTLHGKDVRCVGSRDFESRMDAVAAGQLHVLKLLRAHHRP